MEMGEINNKEVWEGFLLSCEEKSFLDSWNWGEFQKKEGNKIWRLGFYDGEQLVGIVLVVRIKAKRGIFIFVPHGPNIIFNYQFSIFKILVDKLKKIAKQENASFIRIAPIWQRNEENIKIFKNLGFRDAPMHIHPEVTWELDLRPTEEELLRGMRKTTRYLIKQAQKNSDIEIVKSQNIEDIKKFKEIYSETAERHQFVSFSLSYLENQLSCFSPDNILIFLGKYRKEIISAAIIVFWQGMAFYHHGASLLKYNKIPVSYLLQWEAIKEAKNRGCQRYNFWGIAPEGKKNHPWAGLSLFKMGFGGYKKEYVKTQDLVLSWRYWLTYIFEKLRRVKRGL